MFSFRNIAKINFRNQFAEDNFRNILRKILLQYLVVVLLFKILYLPDNPSNYIIETKFITLAN